MKQCFHLKAASVQQVTTKFTHFALARAEFRWEGFVYFNVPKHEVDEYLYAYRGKNVSTAFSLGQCSPSKMTFQNPANKAKMGAEEMAW